MSVALLRCAAILALGLAMGGLARAEDLVTYEIVMKDHKITPSEIHVPTGRPFFVLVTNATGSADEFEMLIPAVEKGLQPGETGRVRIKALGKGHFPFFGESDPDGERGAFVSE